MKSFIAALTVILSCTLSQAEMQPPTIIQEIQTKICSASTRLTVLKASCSRIQTYRNYQEAFDITLEATSSLNVYYPNLTTVSEAQALGREQQDILSLAMKLLVWAAL